MDRLPIILLLLGLMSGVVLLRLLLLLLLSLLHHPLLGVDVLIDASKHSDKVIGESLQESKVETAYSQSLFEG